MKDIDSRLFERLEVCSRETLKESGINDSLKGWRSAAVKLSGLANHLACFAKLRVNGLSMSMTVARFTRSMALAEYSVVVRANTRYRPRLIIGAASDTKPALAADFSKSRRVILIQRSPRSPQCLPSLLAGGRPEHEHVLFVML